VTADEVRAGVSAALEGESGLPSDWADQLATYLSLLQDRNRTVNLVSRNAMDRLIEGQLLPSLAVLRVIPADALMRVVDVGSGGGFPAIPLRILRPRVRLDLVEATGKKCDFLRDAVRKLDLGDAGVHWCRIEDPSAELLARAPFDVLTARAVGAVDRIRAGAGQLLGRGGTAWRFVAPGESAEDLPWPPPGRGEPVTALRRVG
jgi:16S rRNA (guanine527-N7)-methyltransferase